jgi:type VI secretion system protein ImpA
MPSPTLLDFDALIAPIPGEEPAGKPVPFAVREKLEESRREIDPSHWAANDPTRPTEFKKADWQGIANLTQQTLKESSKDLLIAARLTEAMTKLHGFAGFRDGITLLRLLIDQCWDRLIPTIESDEDLEVRAAPFFWLDETDRGARFPATLRGVPLVSAEIGPLGWQHWKDAQSGQGKDALAAFEKAVENAPAEHCKTVAEDLLLGWQALDSLSQALRQKLGPVAPGFSSLRAALGDCQILAQQIAQKKGPAASPQLTETAPPQEATNGAAVVVAANPLATREDIFDRLAEAAAALQRMEPHSPVPYLIRRAIELGSMQFPDLMKNLILNADVLKVMNRELGITETSEKK